jgi:hypothetical protein
MVSLMALMFVIDRPEAVLLFQFELGFELAVRAVLLAE